MHKTQCLISVRNVHVYYLAIIVKFTYLSYKFWRYCLLSALLIPKSVYSEKYIAQMKYGAIQSSENLEYLAKRLRLSLLVH